MPEESNIETPKPVTQGADKPEAPGFLSADKAAGIRSEGKPVHPEPTTHGILPLMRKAHAKAIERGDPEAAAKIKRNIDVKLGKDQ